MKLLDTINKLVHPQRNTFTGVMALYEGNFTRLMKLIPDLAGMPDSAVSGVNGAMSLHLTVLERCKYTTTFFLTYHFYENGDWIKDLGVQIRVYHDARLAEAIACHRPDGYAFASDAEAGHKQLLIRQWQINQFLSKWLDYCLALGHQLTSGSQPASRYWARGLTTA